MVSIRSIFESPWLPILGHLSDAIVLVEAPRWRVIYANPAMGRWLGRRVDELMGLGLEELFSPASRSKVMELVDRLWRGTETVADIQAELHQHEAAIGPIDARLCRIDLGDAPVLAVIVQKASGQVSSASAGAKRRDSLTDLPDREFLFSRLSVLLRGERSADRRFAVLFVDLDNFKQVNDVHGHLVGDVVLREVAHRLTGCVRQGDHVVRYGGDEFVVLVERLAGREEIAPVIDRIHSALASPIALPQGEFRLSLSIGVAEASPEHHSPEDVLHEADRAMYTAKRAAN